MMTLPLALLLALLSTDLGRQVASTPLEYELFFPEVPLQRDEQIEGFSVSVACGHIQSLVSMPADWNVEVNRAVSAVETLHARAGHGISYIKQLDRFDGMIHIRPTDRKCFDVRVTVTAVFDTTRRIALPPPRLKRVP